MPVMVTKPRGWENADMLGDRWGVTDSEVSRPYPCDDFVASPTLSAWRGVSVDAPAEAVWPWIAQVRLAPYAYDWIDNFGRRSPRELMGLAEPRIGERLTAMGWCKMGRIVSVEPQIQLTCTIIGTFLSYVLVPDGQHTRLLMKAVTAVNPLVAAGLCLGDLIMARRQLLNWKSLAEQHHRTTGGR